jgi:hypothetical protein
MRIPLGDKELDELLSVEAGTITEVLADLGSSSASRFLLSVCCTCLSARSLLTIPILLITLHFII